MLEARQGENEDARRHLEESIALNPTYARAHSQLGTVLKTMGDLSAAKAELEKAEKLGDSEIGVQYETNGKSPFPPFASTNYKPPTDSVFPAVNTVGASFARNFKPQTTAAWNASVEQQLSHTMSIRVAYVGSETYHQSYIVNRDFAIYCQTCNNGARASSFRRCLAR